MKTGQFYLTDLVSEMEKTCCSCCLKTMDTESLFESSLLPACPFWYPLKYLPPQRATGIAFFLTRCVDCCTIVMKCRKVSFLSSFCLFFHPVLLFFFVICLLFLSHLLAILNLLVASRVFIWASSCAVWTTEEEPVQVLLR